MKVVYVLSWDGQNYYREQLIASLLSLNKFNPSCDATIVCDRKTHLLIKDDSLLNSYAQILCVSTPRKLDPLCVSKYLKTHLINFISGDFLFIDTDTVIVDDLSSITYVDQTSMVLNHHSPLDKDNFEFRFAMEQQKKTHYHIGYNNKHFNSGIIWVKDNESTHKLFDSWGKLWMETYKKYRIASDQASLNEANYRLGGVINEISGIWNCQLRTGVRYLSSSKIIHYFGSNKHENTTRAFAYNLADTNLWQSIRETNSVTEVMRLLENPKAEFQSANILEIKTPDYVFLHSNYYYLIQWIYRKNKKLYHHIDHLLGILKKSKKMFLNIIKRK